MPVKKTTSLLATAAIAAGVVVGALASSPANALVAPKPQISTSSEVVQVRRKGGGFRHRGMHRHRGIHRHRGFHRHRGYRHRHHRGWRRGFYAVPYVYGGYGYRNCYWLKRRALRTGSRYWWRRYATCKWRGW